MARPVKWARDLHLLRERASRSRVETWSRQDLEHFFGVGRASAQNLMKAIGEVETVAGAHFIERRVLLEFLDAALAAPSVERFLADRLLGAEPPPRPRPLRVALPADLRHAMLPDLPENITLEPGRLEIRAATAEVLLESLAVLATVAQNDLERFRAAIEAEPGPQIDEELSDWMRRLRAGPEPPVSSEEARTD